ncbi:alpha/beta hydrolase [Kiloniella laminariae]|uniref:alpha/beta hydrolase n=1 Tax=Kiloniella laminariae TaxID=454162 RepID=UPI000368A33F|nr:alpha/beta fold hydrolase [Kiloniella laminariae]
MPYKSYRLSAAAEPELFLCHQPAAGTGENLAKRCPVLYIHGATFPSACSIAFPFDGHSWMDDLAAAGFSVWGLDFAGFGQSGGYDRCSRSGGDDVSSPEIPVSDIPVSDIPISDIPISDIRGRMAEASRQIARAVDFILAQEGAEGRGRVSLLAHSWGSIPAGHFAGEHPDLLDRLVLFGPVAQRKTDEAETATKLPDRLCPSRLVTIAQQYSRFIADVPAGQAPVLLDRHFAPWAREYLASDPESAMRSPPAVQIPTGPTADITAAWSGDLPYDPGRITAPTLIVRGAWDSITRDDDAQWLMAALASARIRQDCKLPGGTHLMHLEEGRFELYAAVKDFLASRC